MTTLDLIAAERRRVADELETLTPAQLATGSLCGAWSAHDIGAHLLVPLVLPTRVVALSFVKNRGNFDKVNVDLVKKVAVRSIGEIAAGLRAKAGHRFRPPGYGFEAPLTDLLVHGEDFRRPLGLGHDFDPVALRTSLDFLVTRKAEGIFRPKGLGAGRRLVASDLDWSSGAGPVVEATASDLVMALAGRPVEGVDLRG
jgi:uncharacterized protein (TIGR03083 family)